MHASELVDSLFDEALRLNPNEFNGWMWGGWTKVLLGEHRTAVNYLQHALRLSPLDPRNFFAENVLGFAHFFLGEYELGASCAIAASRHHPDYAPNLRVAMACYALSVDTAAARNLWQQLVLLSPSDRISTQKILGVFRRVEDRVKVAQAYRIAGMPE